jgi:hypothetical protein
MGGSYTGDAKYRQNLIGKLEGEITSETKAYISVILKTGFIWLSSGTNGGPCEII